MSVRQIQLRHDTAANWSTANPTLAVGEIGIETDTNKIKIGNGGTSWNSLGYTLQDATLTLKGLVSLTDSTSSTSTSTAATPNSVKSAYDLANAAIPKSIIDSKGDLVVGSSDNNPIKLSVGADGQVLVADSASPGGVKWIVPNDADAIQNSIIEAKGDIIVGASDNNPVVLPIGLDNQVLTADSSYPNGMRWAASSAADPMPSIFMMMGA